tara:strand:+ start:1323 stop:2276 length:954 start_codon:yes stop_codon:yes gene_type:complete
MSNLYVDTVQPFSTGSRTTLISASLQGLTNISSSQVLYYNTSSGEVYYDDAPTGGGGGGGTAGLISGSGVGSLISANYQPTSSTALGTNSISIGNGVSGDSNKQILLGSNITSSGLNNFSSVTIGTDISIQGSAEDNVIIGNSYTAGAGKNKMVYIGAQPGNNFANQESVAIGYGVGAALGTVALGYGASGGNYAINIGQNSNLGAEGSVTIGYGSTTLGTNAVTLGRGASNNSHNNAITIGYNQTSSAADGINIGGIIEYDGSSTTTITSNITEIGTVLTMTPSDPLPTVATYPNSFAVSASVPYFSDGSTWTALF